MASEFGECQCERARERSRSDRPRPDHIRAGFKSAGGVVPVCVVMGTRAAPGVKTMGHSVEVKFPRGHRMRVPVDQLIGVD